jgi:hypothetical protein
VTDAAAPAPSCDDDYKYCERCMFRGCKTGWATSGPSVLFFEFRWAYCELWGVIIIIISIIIIRAGRQP